MIATLAMLLASVTPLTNNNEYEAVVPFSSSGENITYIVSDDYGSTYYASVSYSFSGGYYFNRNGTEKLSIDYEFNFYTYPEYEDNNGNTPRWNISGNLESSINAENRFKGFDAYITFGGDSGSGFYVEYGATLYGEDYSVLRDSVLEAEVFNYFDVSRSSPALDSTLEITYPSLYDDIGRAHGFYIQSQTEPFNWEQWYESGYSDGYSQGHGVGYNEGFEAGSDLDSTALVIFDGILSIGLIPTQIFMTMLNFNILGINIAGFITGLITILMVVLLIRIIFSGGSGKQ